jgi:hypothetical protein
MANLKAPGIHFETDLIDDAMASLLLLHRRLAARHGEVFRELDRRVAVFIDAEEPIRPTGEARWIDATHGVLLVPRELLVLLAEGKRLGVI